MKPIEKKEPLDNEFTPDIADELDKQTPRLGRMRDLMQSIARQASLDLGNDLGL